MTKAKKEEETPKVERKLCELRIDARTVILVPKEKCTIKYAEYYKKKLENNEKMSKKNYSIEKKLYESLD